MRCSTVTIRCLIVGLGLAMLGCTTPPISHEQLKNLALLTPQDLYGNGAAVTEIDGKSKGVAQQMTIEGPDILPGVKTRPGVNVLPGRRMIQVYVCYAGGAQNCISDTYIFDAKPGLAYVLRGSEQNIVVLDRFQKLVQGSLHPIAHHEFVSDQELETVRRQELTAAADAGIAVMEQRKRDQIFIRKVGALVCQEPGRDIIYVGYVENLAGDKIQIRIADAHFKRNPNLHPSGFSPSTVWDSSIQWGLCR
ncbi:hypothetical protein [Rugamonas sp.]|uniref:hypothetical protein n=1 Tax=Rugamonas sp. TaxID=1926287 RepID=UPI0025CF26E4|nr:hypothetical protein [Rugamonas sp.]